MPPTKLPTRFTANQCTVLQNYMDFLKAETAPSRTDIDRFQSALFSVLFREQEIDLDASGRLSCPVQCYIALLSLRKIGDFVKPGLVTQPISRLIYLSRMLVLQIALRRCGDSERFLS